MEALDQLKVEKILKKTLILFSVLYISINFCYAIDSGEVLSKHYQDIIVLFGVALIISAIHLFSPQLLGNSKKSFILSGSFGGGMAIAYVFIRLMPELDKTHELLGESINFIMLIGFTLFYMLEHTAYHFEQTRKDRYEDYFHLTFSIRLFFSWLYSWLLVFTLIEYVHQSIFTTLLYLVVLGLHILHTDHGLLEFSRSHFISKGRYVLALAPLLGWLASIAINTNNLISDVLIGLLSGFIMFRVFNEELPEHDKSNMFGFISGVVLSTVIMGIVAYID